MKRVAFVTTIVLSTLAVLILLWQLRNVVFVFLFSLALAALMTGPVNFLMRLGWARGWAVITSFFVILGAVILFLFLVTLPLLNEIDPLVRNLILESQRIQDAILRVSGSQSSLATRLPTTDQLVSWWAGGETGPLLQGLLGITQNVGFLLGQFLLGLVISLYWMLDQLRFERLWLSLLSPENRIRARDTWRKVEHDVGSYLRSEFIQFLLSALLLAPIFWLLDVKQPMLLALFVSLAWLVPLIGVIFAVLGATLIGWLTGLDVAIAAAFFTIVVLALLEFYVEPRLYRHERYWNVLVVLVMLVLGDALGLLGLLLAPPVAVAIQIVLNSLLDNGMATVTTAPNTTTQLTMTTSAPAADFSIVLNRLENLHLQLKNSEEGGSLRANSLLGRLSRLISEVKEATAFTSS